MKVLIVYDTVSSQKITGKIAETISQVLKESGVEVDSIFVKDADPATIRNYDCLIVGSPTMYFRASSGMMQFLNSLQKKEFIGKRAASFDTQLSMRMSGNAAEGIEKKLKKLGFQIIAAPLVAYVEGKIEQMQLKDGELEKAKSWAHETAKTLVK